MTETADQSQSRDSEGRYRHASERVCECGHANGEHTAERVKVDGEWVQECIAGDIGAAEPCDCFCFKKARRS